MRASSAARGVVAVALAAVTVVAPIRVLPPEVSAQALASFVVPDETTLAGAVSLPVDDAPPAPETLPGLAEIRDAAAAQATELPAADWDVDALAAALSFDPDQAYEFVRDRIGFDPYEGVLRGAEGTLAARAGNALDRALLLAALLDAMGVEHRFAVADLDDASVDRVLERALVAPLEPLPTPGIELTALDASAIATRATRDYARLREALGDRVDAIPGADANVMREAVRHHAWVQAAFGTGWRDLDPTLPDALIGTTIVPPSETPASLPDDAWHTVTLRVVAGTVGDAGLTEHTVIERTFRADEAAASDVFVTFVPYDANLGTVIAQALSGESQWTPLLVVETDVATGEPFAVSSRGTDVFGDQTEVVELATLRLIVEGRAPDGSTSEAERLLLDRLPDGASEAITADELTPMAGDENGPYALSMFHHLLVSTGGTDLREYAIERSVSADYVGTSLDSDLPIESYDLPGILWPVAIADQSLVVASEAAIVKGLEADGRVRSFVGEPRLTLMSAGRDARDGSVAYATDLLVDGVSLLPGPAAVSGDLARRQLWYGALQTALETEIAIRRATLLDPATRTIDGISLMGADGLRTLSAADAASMEGGVPPSLQAALASGALVLAPEVAGRPQAWWTVDPRTGAARSILDPGLGGAVPRGPAAPGLRILDTSYTHGAGGRLPPRPPMIRPPPGGAGGGGGGGALTSPRAAPSVCGPSDSTGYIATISCVSMVAVASWVLLGVGVAGLVIIWYLILTT